MGEHSLNPIDPGPAADRRARLIERAERAGVGLLHISNSTQELLALVAIGKAAREARAQALHPETSRAERPDAADSRADGAGNTAWRQRSPADDGGGAAQAAQTAQTAQTSAFAGKETSLLENMLQTSGRVVSKTS